MFLIMYTLNSSIESPNKIITWRSIYMYTVKLYAQTIKKHIPIKWSVSTHKKKTDKENVNTKIIIFYVM